MSDTLETSSNSLSALSKEAIALKVQEIKDLIKIPEGYELTDCFYRSPSNFPFHASIVATIMPCGRNKMHSIGFDYIPDKSDLADAVNEAVYILSRDESLPDKQIIKAHIIAIAGIACHLKPDNKLYHSLRYAMDCMAEQLCSVCGQANENGCLCSKG